MSTISKLLKSKRVAGAFSTIAVSVAGSAVRHQLKKAHQVRNATVEHRYSDVEEWANTAKEHAKKWLRENEAPNRIKDVMSQWLKEENKRGPVVDTVAKDEGSKKTK